MGDRRRGNGMKVGFEKGMKGGWKKGRGWEDGKEGTVFTLACHAIIRSCKTSVLAERLGVVLTETLKSPE